MLTRVRGGGVGVGGWGGGGGVDVWMLSCELVNTVREGFQCTGRRYARRSGDLCTRAWPLDSKTGP